MNDSETYLPGKLVPDRLCWDQTEAAESQKTLTVLQDEKCSVIYAKEQANPVDKMDTSVEWLSIQDVNRWSIPS